MRSNTSRSPPPYENLICKIDGCSKNVRLKSYGLCSMHETRFRTHGTFGFNKKQDTCFDHIQNPRNIGEKLW